MKKLDEIIKWVKDSQPDDDQMVKLHENEVSDVIHYLEEYREMLNNLENEPLDWAELKLMKGKPLWMEWGIGETKYTGWVIVTAFGNNAIVTKERVYYAHEYGILWKAYRHERK